MQAFLKYSSESRVHLFEQHELVRSLQRILQPVEKRLDEVEDTFLEIRDKRKLDESLVVVDWILF